VGPGSAKRTSFVNCALRELSVGLCMGNFLSYQASVGMLARSSGASFRAGLSVPTDECVEWYCVVFACLCLSCQLHVHKLVFCNNVHIEVLSAAVNALAGCC
jgi:hypothetical protein